MEEQRDGLRILNRDEIKYFAMLAMLLNHIANIFLVHGTLLAEIFLDIGYFTAITMCYFMVEGYQYTRSKRSYGIRLFVFALVSQFPFSFAFQHNGSLSMIYTLFLCFLILVVRERVERPALRKALQVALALLTGFGDWPFFAAAFVILFDEARLGRRRFWDAYIFGAVSFGVVQALSYSTVFALPKALLCAAGSCFGMLLSGFVLRYLYNGKRAEHGRNISKWFFYVFYPAHLLILGIIDRMM